jgi:Mrp family chromosome partitioning ATPase
LGEVTESIPLLEIGGAREAASIEATSAGSLRVLPVGLAPPNPSEFVRSRALAALLEDLSAQADIVLADAPPLLNLSDTMTLSGYVDGLVAVARLPFLKRSTLHEFRRILDAAPAAKLGFVVTGAGASESYGGYEYESAQIEREHDASFLAPDAST